MADTRTFVTQARRQAGVTRFHLAGGDTINLSVRETDLIRDAVRAAGQDTRAGGPRSWWFAASVTRPRMCAVRCWRSVSVGSAPWHSRDHPRGAAPA